MTIRQGERRAERVAILQHTYPIKSGKRSEVEEIVVKLG